MKIGNQSNIKNYFKVRPTNNGLKADVIDFKINLNKIVILKFQEMQGSKPKKPSEEPISECIESIEILDSDSDYMP